MGDGIFGAFGEGIKSIGKAATSQITGSSDASAKSTVDASSQLGGLGKSFMGQIAGGSSSGQSQSLPVDEQLKGLGSSLFGQITGSASGGDEGKTKSQTAHHGFWDEIKAVGLSALGQVSGKDLEEMKQKDKEFSEVSAAQVEAKIKAIYDQYAAKRQQEAAMEKQQQKQMEQQKQEITKERKKETMDVEVAQTKANAEIKNMGAE